MANKIRSGVDTSELTIGATSKAAYTTDIDSTGRDLSVQSKQTFSASGTFTPAATPTDLVVISGSATKTVRVISMCIGTTNTAAGSQQFLLIKRGAADTGGTPVTATVVPLDSNNTATAAVIHYTANPTINNTVGTINTIRVGTPAAIPATWAGITDKAKVELLDWMSNSILDQPVTLRGTAQQLAINFNGVALVAGQTHTYTVVWMEE